MPIRTIINAPKLQFNTWSLNFLPKLQFWCVFLFDINGHVSNCNFGAFMMMRSIQTHQNYIFEVNKKRDLTSFKHFTAPKIKTPGTFKWNVWKYEMSFFHIRFMTRAYFHQTNVFWNDFCLTFLSFIRFRYLLEDGNDLDQKGNHLVKIQEIICMISCLISCANIWWT